MLLESYLKAIKALFILFLSADAALIVLYIFIFIFTLLEMNKSLQQFRSISNQRIAGEDSKRKVIRFFVVLILSVIARCIASSISYPTLMRVF